jgi:hypothetical protein
MTEEWRTVGTAMTDLASLIERLRAATGPDRELDNAIYEAFRGLNGVAKLRYTGSLDAAMTLVPSDRNWSVRRIGVKFAGLVETGTDSGAAFVTSTPAIALCIAALLARDAAARAQEAPNG